MTGRARRLVRRLRGALAGRRGMTAIEMGLVAPVIILTLLGTFDIGWAVISRIRLEAAARAGAQYALAFPSDRNGIRDAVRNSLPSSWTDVVISDTTMSCRCQGAATSCNSLCNNENPERYISVTVTRQFSPTLLYFLSELKGDVQLRVQ